MMFDGRPIRASISTNFMVSPSQRSSLAGIELLKAYFAGPQDVALAEGNEMTRKVWLWLGGVTSILQSIHWLSPLRPTTYLAGRLADDNASRALVAPALLLARLADTVIARLSRAALRRPQGDVRTADMDVPTFVRCVEEFGHDRRVRPVYDERSAAWLLDLLKRKTKFGQLRQRVVYDPSGRIIGWYLWYHTPGELGHVAQIVARPDAASKVLVELFHEAWQGRATGLAGRLEPSLMSELASMVTFFGRKHSWMLLHAKDQEILHAIQAGDAFFTRLEGEWWIPYHEGPR
jgi:hypothetical protein